MPNEKNKSDEPVLTHVFAATAEENVVFVDGLSSMQEGFGASFDELDKLLFAL